MFLLLRNLQTEKDEVVNVGAMQTAYAVESTLSSTNEPFSGTTVVWTTDNRYQKHTASSTQQETLYDIPFSTFIEIIGAHRVDLELG